MSAGAFGERLVLQRPHITRDTLGGRNVTWLDAGATWAMLGGNGENGVKLEQSQIQPHASYRFLIRRRRGLTCGWRILWRGYCLTLRTVIEQSGGLMQLHAEEGTSL